MSRLAFILPILLWCTSAMSAEILVMNRDCVSDDAYKQNDVVSVAEDGFYEKSTGYTEANGFHVIHKDGVPVEDVKYLEQPLTEQVAKVDPLVNVAPVKGGKTMALDVPSEEMKIAPQEMTTNTVRIRKYSVSSKGVISEKNIEIEKVVKAVTAEAILE